MERSTSRQKEKNSLRRKFQAREIICFTLLAVAVIYISVYSEHFTASRFLQNQWLKVLTQISAPSRWSAEHSAVVAYDNASLRAMGFPLPRKYYGQAVGELAAYSPRSLSFDILFGESKDLAGTFEFANALETSKIPIALAAIHSTEWIPAQDLWQDAKPKFLPALLETESTPLETSWPPILSSRRAIALTESQIDEDGVLRWYPLVHAWGGGYIPSLGFSSMLQYLGAENFEVLTSDQGISQIRFSAHGETTILDLDADPEKLGRILLVPMATAGEFQAVSLVDLLDKKVEADFLKNKAIFFAATADGVRGSQATMLDSVQIPVQNHVFAFESLMNGKIFKRVPYGDMINIVLGLVLLGIALLLPAANLYFMFLVMFILTCLLSVSSLWLWSCAFYPQAMGLAAAILGFGILQLMRRFDSDQRQKRNLQKSFSHYLHPALVRRIGETEEVVELGGETRTLTIYFCDLRNFTSLSEALPPEDLVSLMNEYFEIITEEIQRTEGTVDKYIGDAVMAFWNAPLALQNPALRAFESCGEIEKAFALLGKRWQARLGSATLDMGMAIHQGHAIVGNVGSKNRFNYTAIGDDVNLTSRLEGLTKYYQVRTLISGAVQEVIKSEKLVLLDRVRVKGKVQPVDLYVDFASVTSEKLRNPWQKFFEYYQQAEWLAAETILSEELKALPWSKEFGQRITFLKTKSVQWDGIWSFENK